ncbi:hypothetical protein [Capnocytophaga sp. H2931]|uniref:hypothetical protein n=1 Tax=Capnocytophaga sp. H2931 TaxID=1945657 RepID=UPI000BB16B4D|nr:hypothetical protein [Capnocytophaga sp. H2931]ATA75253.1 hypothetical protein CGC52_07400 [Capnocytophaga sp. H2931]
MQRTQQIINILQTDYIGYSSLRHAYFMHWCREQCERHYLPLKTLAMHDSVVQWYETEWHHVIEQQVFQGIEDLIPLMSPDDLLGFIDIQARQIHKNYPAVLFQMLRKEFNNNVKTKAI